MLLIIAISFLIGFINLGFYMMGRKRGVYVTNKEWDKYVEITEDLVSDYIKETNEHISGIVAKGAVKTPKKERN